MSLTDFTLLSKIGEGSFSSVHKVKRISDGHVYALKKVKLTTLKEKQKQNALNEVRLLASITSDYIIRYKESFFDTKENALCIVMEFADGGDLEKLIMKKKKTLTWIEERSVWMMIKHIVTALVNMHEKNIIHRDLKSANIFISERVYKLGDFNVSKLLKKALAYTQTGTPYYASPEVWKDQPYELKSDIWSLGCIIYEMCALRPPFTANSMDGLYKKVLKGAYPRIPPAYSNDLEKLIAKCLKIDPKNRPTAKELLKIIPSYDSESEDTKSSINLLNTIKIPRTDMHNSECWKDQLPKSNYMNQSLEEEKDYDRGKPLNFGHQRLKQIVRQKREEHAKNIQKKKGSFNRLPPSQKVSEEPVKKIDPKSLLPRLKIHSEPIDENRVKESNRNNKYHYLRPSWWG